MLKKTIKYSLLLIGMWGLSACSTPRTITVNQPTNTTIKKQPTVTPTKRPSIKEEILLGDKKNTLLGERVDVPVNNPVLGEIIEEYGQDNVTSETYVESKSQIIERMSFPVDEYKRIPRRGSNTVSGKIYLENSHSSLEIKGKKIKLWLNPVTSYSRQWYQESYLGGYKLSKTDKRLYNYLKFTYSDNSGKFNFFGVPSGDYYLTGTMKCAEECGYSKSKSIRLVREISVGRGVTTVNLMKNVP